MSHSACSRRAASFFMKNEPAASKPRFAWIRFAALSIGVAAFQIMLDRGGQMDWFSSVEIIVEACVGGLAFYLFLVHFFWRLRHLSRQNCLSIRILSSVWFSFSLPASSCSRHLRCSPHFCRFC
jgi:hypothetical protein